MYLVNISSDINFLLEPITECHKADYEHPHAKVAQSTANKSRQSNESARGKKENYEVSCQPQHQNHFGDQMKFHGIGPWRNLAIAPG